MDSPFISAIKRANRNDASKHERNRSGILIAPPSRDMRTLDKLTKTRPADAAPIPPESRDADPADQQTNRTRALGAFRALLFYASDVGEEWSGMDAQTRREVQQQNMQDLLSDLAHLADRLGIDFQEAYDTAARRYSEETNGQGAQFQPFCVNCANLDN